MGTCPESRSFARNQADKMTEDINQLLETASTKDENDHLTSPILSEPHKQSIDGPSDGTTPSPERPQTTTTTTTRKVTFWSLPRELRDMIWNEALLSEDEIFAANISCTCQFEDLETHIRNSNAMPIELGQGFPGLVYASRVFSCQPPALAHVCQESREDALRRYESAYRKFQPATDPKDSLPLSAKLFEKMEGRLRWLSGKVARYLCIGLLSTDFELHDEEDLEEEEVPEVQVETEEDGSRVPSQDRDELEAPRVQDDNYETPLEDGDNAKIDVEERDWPGVFSVEPTWEDYLDNLEEAPLWEDDLLVLHCLWMDRQPMTISNFVRSALLDLLARAKDYQIMVVCGFPGHDTVPFSDSVIVKWGVFANRASDCNFDKTNYNHAKRFVDIRDLEEIFDFVCFVRSFWCYDGSEEEKEIENLLNNLELRKRLVAECLEPFETLWAEGVKGIKSSRYGRMPRLGVVVEMEQK
ncbi:hypothetical protein QBC32DRAFT_341310 [Pseudoneurospora amorphoporcata]|uniref:2EXR domain-containing protein n=1 Tax=Pseudoneurospora amorphoporcata TaxID=241081 RepID=A0AAN6SGK0_9PEZI|nr:hypothetical protein QBC32DRAFT_341310 [Pseudoneurospora amorphoporcata]